jgi:serine/threonine-protein kinase
MGRVYRAVDVARGREVALKIASSECTDPTQRALLERELALMARVKHPNIVEAIGGGIHADRAWIAMELLDCTTLHAELEQRGRLPVPEAISMAHQACLGLAALHAAGIVHRDLKPANLLLDRVGGVKIADFGVAKDPRMPTLTATGELVGTPAFLAPEVIRGDPHDHRADVYQIGMILYLMLCGALPHEAASLAAHLAAVVSTPPRPLREHVPDMRADLEAFVLRCLSAYPAARPGSAGEMAVALGRLGKGDAPARVASRPSTGSAAAARWPATPPSRAIAGLAAVALVATIVVLAPVGRSEPTRSVEAERLTPPRRIESALRAVPYSPSPTPARSAGLTAAPSTRPAAAPRASPSAPPVSGADEQLETLREYVAAISDMSPQERQELKHSLRGFCPSLDAPSEADWVACRRARTDPSDERTFQLRLVALGGRLGFGVEVREALDHLQFEFTVNPLRAAARLDRAIADADVGRPVTPRSVRAELARAATRMAGAPSALLDGAGPKEWFIEGERLYQEACRAIDIGELGNLLNNIFKQHGDLQVLLLHSRSN